MLDRCPQCFSDMPGHVDVVEHAVTLADGFGPRRLSACRVPERLGLEVDRRIREMLEIGVIGPSQSPMVMCVFNGQDGRDDVHLRVDYRDVNRFTRGDVFLLPDIGCVFQCRDRNHFIRITDCKTRPWQQVFRVIVRPVLISLTQVSGVIQ